ncbi:hypothetical protein BDZ94DRAFT_1256255 [Collybia nuda]|uniref:Uncharacterized protein n=1 Tax=Collybia nuda TaxID=64659 RepID=A0A9P5YAL0_9AGAR|nr:hypothetical protein BDZ94DRAFT_1256255 [Collybia nuda]
MFSPNKTNWSMAIDRSLCKRSVSYLMSLSLSFVSSLFMLTCVPSRSCLVSPSCFFSRISQSLLVLWARDFFSSHPSCHLPLCFFFSFVFVPSFASATLM